MEVLISIRHQYAERIYAGTKKFELRKGTPHISPGTKCYIYEPMPVGKVTGYFIFQGSVKCDKYKFWELFKNECGITTDDYFNYYQKKRNAYAWRIAGAHRYEDPFTLQDMGCRAPQSYLYIRHD